MKTAICAFCAQTGMLCKDCQTKLNSGEISDTDIQISKVAVEFEKLHPNVSNVAILNTIENSEFIIILVAPGNLRFLVGGTLDFHNRLERVLKKPVKILEKSKNKRKAIDGIFSPALISGINTVFVPARNPKPGQISVEEETIVVLSPDEKIRLPGKLEDLIELVKLIAGVDIRVEFR
ncbi:MAG: hypothetical protein HZR80_15275 [Candidatus Heimdallarchaeota archaeon]